MKNKILLSLIFGVFIFDSMQTVKATDVSGVISTNTVWNLAGSPYIVTGNIMVNSGVTLTIDSLVVVKFNNSRNMLVNGSLVAKSATFTSSSATPNAGIWDNIQFGNSTYSGQGTLLNCNFSWANQIYILNGTVSFQGCTLDNFYYYGFQCSDTLNIKDTYINMPAYYSSYGYGINALANAYITADNLDIGNCRYGFNIAAAAKVFTTNGSSVTGADQYGAYVAGQLSMTSTDIDLTGYTYQGYGIETGNGSIISLNQVNITHANYALHIYANTNVSITDCNFTSNTWPGYYEGPGAVTTAGTNNFTGNTRNAFYINFNSLSVPWILPSINVPYYFYLTFTINTGSTLSILSGNILKIPMYNGLTVNGTLIANSNPGTYIYFTSERDDNWGGDTNNDGTTTTPATGDWYGITFNDASIDASCVLRRCKVRFAGYNSGGAVNTIAASPTIDYCELSNSYFGIKMQGASSPVFTNNTIGSSQMTPIAISYEANPVLTGNILSFSDNAYDAIGLLGGTMTANAVLPVRNISTVQNITYLMLDNITIPQGMTLTINKGVVIKTYYPTSSYNVYRKFIVEGKLTAIGAPDSMIVFTSARDDNFGNPFDSNKDGSQTSPIIGDWGGFLFKATSDTTSTLNYCRIYYGDNNDHVIYNSPYPDNRTYRGGQITLENASPAIMNCIIKHNEFGVYCAGNSHPRVFNNSFDHSTVVAVARSISGTPYFTGNTIVNCGFTALGVIGEELGLGGTLGKQDFAGYSNITYLLLDELYINSGTNVAIDSGVVVKVNTSSSKRRIEVNGGLKINGGTNPGNEVVFTSSKDDNVGNPGDSNNDGSTTSPAAGDWGRIQYNETSDDLFSQVKNLKVKYGGYGEYNSIKGSLAMISANTSLENILISNSSNYGFYVDGSSIPVIHQAVIQSCTNDPIAMSLTADPQFTNITFLNNGSNGIRIIEGTLSSNATLKKRNIAGFNNIAYIVEQLTISSNAVLTIEPGVVIKFQYYELYNSYSSKGYIIVNGALSAIGTMADPIIFTSSRDDSKGGDTNNDGNTTIPDKGDWRYIEFNSSSVAEENQFKNCIVSYGGAYNPGWPGYDLPQRIFKRFAEVCINSTLAVVDSCIFEHSGSSGIGIYGNATPMVAHSDFSNIAATPITMSLFSEPVFGNGNTLSNVGLTGLGLAVENFSVNDTVRKRNFSSFQNITYIIYSSCVNMSSYFTDLVYSYSSINNGTTIVIPKGIVFKYKLYDYSTTYSCQTLDVNGGIKILGTSSEPVVFTDYRDDGYGNPMDSNGDGTLTTPQINNQYILSFNSTSDDANCIINHAIFKYQKNAVQIQQASPSIKNSLFEKNNWGINLNGVSEPVIDSCTFHNLTYTPLEFSLVSFPSSTIGNIISGATYKALGVKAETMAQNVTLSRRSFGGLINIPYYFHDNFTIGTSSVMTVEPGVVLKFNDSKSLTIKKGLWAVGGSTADSNIVFTDIRDDFYGGDSNSDGTATQPGYLYTYPYYQYPWSGLTFENESNDALCKLDHCIVRYAGYNYDQYGLPGIRTNSASPSILNTSVSKNRIGIQANYASNPVINNCDIYGNQVYGVQNVGLAFNINAENCWWGNNTGPTHSGNPGGTGDAVTDMVDYNPFRNTGAGNPIMGDVSLNGIVQAYDASLVLQYVIGSITLNSTQQQVADVSAAAGITPYDASLILQYVVGLIQGFPAEDLAGGPPSGITPENIADSISDNGESPVQTIGMRVPDTTVVSGDFINIPVYADNSLTGQNVMSYMLQFSYNQSYLQPVSVITAGTLSAPFGNPYVNTSVPGMITIAGAGTTPITGTGKFIYIRFTPLQPGGIWLNFTGAQFNYFNEGNPLMSFDNGYVNIVAPPSITVSPNSGIIAKGEQLQFTVSGGTAPYQWFVTNPSVATINTTGLLTGTQQGLTKVVAQDNNGLKDTTNAQIEIRAMRLAIPSSLSQWQGADIDVPVNTTDLDGLDIYSGNFTITFNQNILTPVGVVQAGTLLASYPAPTANFIVPGNATIGFAGTAPLTGSGTLIYVKFHVSPQNTGTTAINFVNGLFNENLLPAFTNGSFTTINLPVLSISPNGGSLVAGQTQQFTLNGGGTPPIQWSVNDPAIASISQDGLATTIKGGNLTVSAVDFHGASATTANWLIYDTQIIMPDTTTGSGAQIFYYPIFIKALPAGESVYSIQSTVTYNSTFLTFQAVETSGTLTQGWTFATNPATGQVIIAGSGTNSFNTAGIIMKLKFLISPDFIAGSNAFVQLPSVLLNEGVPLPSVDINGSITGVNMKILDLHVYLEGLYNSAAGLMNEAMDGNSGLPEFGAGIADRITVELHSAANYGTIVYTAGNMDLSTTGTATVSIPFTFNDSYYITIRHRNSIETTTALPVSFSGTTISYDFSTAASQAYGNNMNLMGTVDVIYGGDATQDGFVDGSDMAVVDNASTAVLIGFNPEDVNGDGIVDGSDMALVDNNSTAIVHAVKP